MAYPQLENGYTKLNNESVEALARINIPGRCWRILMVIFRKTYGWGKQNDEISLSQFCLLTGLKIKDVCACLKHLEKMNIIKRNTPKNGSTYINNYSFIKDYDVWVATPKNGNFPKMGIYPLPKMGIDPLPKMGDTKESITKESITKESITKERTHNLLPECKPISENTDYDTIQECWNNLKIEHRNISQLTGNQIKEIKERLKNNNVDEICKGLENYGILNNMPNTLIPKNLSLNLLLSKKYFDVLIGDLKTATDYFTKKEFNNGNQSGPKKAGWIPHKRNADGTIAD